MQTIESILTNPTGDTLPAQTTKKTDSTPSFSNTLKAISNPLSCPSDMDEYFTQAAKKYGVDKNLLMAIGKEESNFQSDATSSSGAMGVMQLMPSTAKSLGVTDAYDAKQNIMGGAKLLASHLKKYNGDTTLALAAYGAGGGAVDKYGGVPPYTETQNAIKKVMAFYAQITNSGTVITAKEAVEEQNSTQTNPSVSPPITETTEDNATISTTQTDGTQAATQKKLTATILSLLMNYIRQQMVQSAASLLSTQDNATSTSSSLAQSVQGSSYSQDDYLNFTNSVVNMYKLFDNSDNNAISLNSANSNLANGSDANAFYQYEANTSNANPAILNIMQSVYSQDKR